MITIEYLTGVILLIKVTPHLNT